MARRGPRWRIKEAVRRVERGIAVIARDGGRYGAGMAGEGYDGGYRDALHDVLLVLDGIRPNRQDYWVEW